MILIITHKEDYTCDFLINKLNQKNIKYKRFNCEDIMKHEFIIDSQINCSILGQESFSSIWFRRTKLPEIENLEPKEQIYLLNEYDSFLKNLFSILDANWVSDPFSVYKAENKLLQLKIAKEIGFIVPDTLLTNSKEKLRVFYLEHDKDIVIKPLSQSRIFDENTTSFLFTNSLKEEHIENIENFDLTPCIYQARIEKDIELRITVVGENVFSAGVNSQSDEETLLDWRKKHLQFFITEIPEEIKSKCVQIVKKLNLQFGAIDIIKDKNGNYIFLEINPNGQWAWIETETGLPISDAIIKTLLNE